MKISLKFTLVAIAAATRVMVVTAEPPPDQPYLRGVEDPVPQEELSPEDNHEDHRELPGVPSCCSTGGGPPSYSPPQPASNLCYYYHGTYGHCAWKGYGLCPGGMTPCTSGGNYPPVKNYNKVEVTVNDQSKGCFKKIYNADGIVDWYGYQTDESWSANSGLEDNNSGKIGVAAIKVKGGMTGVAYIYDEPEDGSGGTVNAVTRWEPTGYTGSEPAVEDDSHERRDEYTASYKKLITNHIWNPCCTDGFATQPMGKDFKVCTAFKKGRTGVDDGIFFYEMIGGNYNPTKIKGGTGWAKVCISDGCSE